MFRVMNLRASNFEFVAQHLETIREDEKEASGKGFFDLVVVGFRKHDCVEVKKKRR